MDAPWLLVFDPPVEIGLEAVEWTGLGSKESKGVEVRATHRHRLHHGVSLGRG
jgi:hypothetical protein